MSQWISVKEYAALWDVTEETVRVWIRTKRLMAARVGDKGHWRIQHNPVTSRNFVSSQEQPTSAPS